MRAGFPESDNDSVIQLVTRSEMSKNFKTFDLTHLWEYKSHFFVGLVTISNDYLSGRTYETVYETQIIVVAKDDQISNHVKLIAESDSELNRPSEPQVNIPKGE